MAVALASTFAISVRTDLPKRHPTLFDLQQEPAARVGEALEKLR